MSHICTHIWALFCCKRGAVLRLFCCERDLIIRRCVAHLYTCWGPHLCKRDIIIRSFVAHLHACLGPLLFQKRSDYTSLFFPSPTTSQIQLYSTHFPKENVFKNVIFSQKMLFSHEMCAEPFFFLEKKSLKKRELFSLEQCV